MAENAESSDKSVSSGPVESPELVIGIAGAIGVDLELIVASISDALSHVQYESSLTKLTDEINRYVVEDPQLMAEVDQWNGADSFNSYMRKMSFANALRKEYKDGALLARIAIEAIRSKRKELTGDENKTQARHAYIIRQLKRPEEVALLRQVYGRQFVLVSAYAPEEDRRERLYQRLKQELPTETRDVDVKHKADQLIDRDASEDEEKLGQQLRETFHRADVFIDGLKKAEMESKINRFVCAFFGKNDVSPSKDEYGMYAAKSAALRSADLSRQVGAALFSSDGELITQGCNEVPKAFGGTYWDLESPDHRDVKKGYDPNERFKKNILRDLVERLRKNKFLSENLTSIGTDAQIVDALIARKKEPETDGALAGSQLMDMTEYGRVVHAEMSAVCDAARLGRSIKGTTLFVTTFPCHNCTKHLLASGVRRVVYMEPYPKSRAKDLHPDEIEVESESKDKVAFVPFMGISPFRYRDIFQKGKRKNEQGNADVWYQNEKRPLVDSVFPSYPETEVWALAPLLGEVKQTRQVS